MAIKYTKRPSPYHVARNGKWVDERNDSEKLKGIRVERNNILQKYDWTQLPDVPDNIKVPFKEWRQKLRDVTKSGTVEEINSALKKLVIEIPVIK